VPAATGLISSAIAVLIAVCPIVDVVSNLEYAGKIVGVVMAGNLAGVLVYGLPNSNRSAACDSFRRRWGSYR
jgi:hypothetical protein